MPIDPLQYLDRNNKAHLKIEIQDWNLHLYYKFVVLESFNNLALILLKSCSISSHKGVFTNDLWIPIEKYFGGR